MTRIDNREEMERFVAEVKEHGLPPLEGSEKQVEWASRIRDELYRDMSRYVSSRITDEEKDKLREAIIYVIQHTSASFYIDNRDAMFDQETMRVFLADMLRRVRDAEETSGDEWHGVQPKELVKPGKVIVTVLDSVSASYIKDDDFKEIVKQLGFSWDTEAWVQKPSFKTGDTDEIAARLISDLLSGGFRVECNSKNAIDRAASGDFTPLHTRWVSVTAGGKYFAIAHERNDEVYQAARKLPRSQYKSGHTVVPLEFAEFVEDFASVYGFSLSPKATSTIKAAHDKEYAIVTPAKKGTAANTASVKDILASDRSVINDLKD